LDASWVIYGRDLSEGCGRIRWVCSAAEVAGSGEVVAVIERIESFGNSFKA